MVHSQLLLENMYSRVIDERIPFRWNSSYANTFLHQFVTTNGGLSIIRIGSFFPRKLVGTDYWLCFDNFWGVFDGDRALSCHQSGIICNSNESFPFFFCLLKLYNLNTGTFFTPYDELVLALQEMYEVLGLPIGEIPYEEYVPIGEELYLLKAQHTLIYDTY